MTKSAKIIGIVGKKGVGKTFVSDLIASTAANYKVVQVSFADELKKFCVDGLGLTETQCYGTDEHKNTFTKYQWPTMPTWILDKYPEKCGYMTAREVMQILGTDIMRGCFCDQIWIEATERKIERSSADLVVISDVRFKNEVNMVRARGGSIWKIVGPQRVDQDVEDDTHLSETSLDGAKHDQVIYNGESVTREDVAKQINSILLSDYGMSLSGPYEPYELPVESDMD